MADCINQNKLDKILSKPWAPDGKQFSPRIWENRTKLVNELHRELSLMCIRGEAPDRAIKSIAKKMNTSKVNAGRLVMTEAAYFSSASQKDCFNDLGVEQYEISATLDSHTSPVCQEMDGKVFDMKEYEPGVTAPPFHVWCRSCTVPYFNDEFTAGEKRIARGEDGKNYYVSAKMKYPEWKGTFVDNSRESAIINKAKEKLFNSFGIKSTSKITAESIEKEMQRSEIGKEVIENIHNSDITIQLLQGMSHPDGRRGDQVGNIITIYLDCNKDSRVAAQTVIHEMTHYYYDIGGCQWAEAVCFAKEKMHIECRKKLTHAEKRYVVDLAKKNYPEYKWKKGGYRNEKSL